MGTDRRFQPGSDSSGRQGRSQETAAATRPRGSARRGRLGLPRRRPLREGMLTAFSGILAAGRRAARGVAADPVKAVHDYRKALRRARAIIGLLGPALGKASARAISVHLQTALRATSALRDADVLLATLRGLPSGTEDDLARHAIGIALELEQGRTLRETSEALGAGLVEIASLPAALGVILDPEFSARDLERGLARSRRRERRALDRARDTASDEDLHEWRKRVKELRYQVELLASTGSPELARREKMLAELARDLGEVTDRIVLAGEIRRRAAEGAVPPAPALLQQIGDLVSERSRQLLERGSALCEEDPKNFARQVIAERG